ncbi:MAG: hypothetical protein IIA59_09305 [Candidatus Marinimicrobia bacterium]|nr:hypothetical protein [Candidatus Neomarinimicrobiota bacterium]
MSHTFVQPESRTASYQPSTRRRSVPVHHGPMSRSKVAFDIGLIPIAPAVQAKLTISQPGDKHEQEADRVADRIMIMLGSNAH